MKVEFKKIAVFLSVVFFSGNALSQATIDSLNQNADQSQGNYPVMNLDYAGMGSLGMMQSAWLDPLQNLGEGQTKPAYSKYYWSPDLVLPVRVRTGMLTLINFPEWELLENVYIGDESTFNGEITGPNTLLLYPAQGTSTVGVDTNVMVFGRSGNKYVFYVRSEGVNTERLTNSVIDIEVVGGQKKSAGGSGSGGSLGGRLNANAYGAGDNKSVDATFTRRYQKEDWIQSIPLDPSQFKFDIEVYVPNPDDVVIAPERVWRDDIFTYIDLGEKALNMTQRPIVTLIVERVETPVGFRAKGPNNRLIVVEGVGDMVLRNGKRIVCLKLRRSDDAGMYDIRAKTNDWDVPPPLPSGKNGQTKNSEVQGFELTGGTIDSNTKSMWQTPDGQAKLTGEYEINMGPSGELLVPEYAFQNGRQAGAQNSGYRKMYKLQPGENKMTFANSLEGYRYGVGFESDDAASISVELGTDSNVANLETLWSDLARNYGSILKGYQPFYSVDAPADGQGKELFHLRIGPVDSIDVGDEICGALGRNGVFCSVIRIQ
ncbi:MAG: TrbG/VirB9 family P-type conjugative transfer protein [Alphaproteobacteria bacterium]|nr:TrbG/VirB9 family P-type conjugative transfer protein [Alphaproteobacteria bacterium]